MADIAPPATTDPALRVLAEAALARLARDGAEDRDETGARRWRAGLAGGNGEPVEVVCTGPDLPAAVPGEIATPDRIARERPWAGTYRLVVTARLIVLDLYWTPGEPMRVMGFSRGDWEKTLLER